MIHIDHSSETPIYRQVYLQIRAQIESGEIPAGAHLPGIRELAHELGVARNTIESAYRQLSREGYASGKPGRGYLVEAIDLSLVENHQITVDLDPFDTTNVHGNDNPLGGNLGCSFDFCYGNRSPKMVPVSHLRSHVDALLTKGNLEAASCYIDPFGLPHLRLEIAKHLAKTRDVQCSPEQIILQPGTQSALDAIASLFDDDERTIAFEEPGYTAARNIFEAQRFKIRPIPTFQTRKEHLESLEESNAKLAFLTPSNQFPLGNALPLGARLQVIDWARRNDAYIIEDDYCCEFFYDTQPVPSLHSLGSDRVIYMGTMSKIYTPSCRISYLVLPPELLKRWIEKRGFRFCPIPWLNQELLACFMESDAWSSYVRSTVANYRKSHDLLLKCIHEKLGNAVTIQGAGSGLHILLGDARRRDQHELIQLAARNDVRVYETDSYWMTPDHPMKEYVLVGFSAIDPTLIPEGIARLARAWGVKRPKKGN